MTKELLQAAKQRVEAAPKEPKAPWHNDLRVISLKTLSKGSAARKYGENKGRDIYAFKVKMEQGTELVFGSFEGGNKSSAGRAVPPFGQYTKSEWNATFRDLWSSAKSDVLEFMPCEDGTVFFYVYGSTD
jgi:hypothetical protein